MYCVVQIGSRIARLEWGTTRRTFSWASASPEEAIRISNETSIRMRKSPRKISKGRVSGHGTHRNRRHAARNQYLCALKGRLHGLRGGRRLAGRAVRRAPVRCGGGGQHFPCPCDRGPAGEGAQPGRHPPGGGEPFCPGHDPWRPTPFW